MYKKGTKLLLAYKEYILEFIIECSRSELRYKRKVMGVWSSGMILALGDNRVNSVGIGTSMREALGSIPSSPLFILFTRFKNDGGRKFLPSLWDQDSLNGLFLRNLSEGYYHQYPPQLIITAQSLPSFPNFPHQESQVTALATQEGYQRIIFCSFIAKTGRAARKYDLRYKGGEGGRLL